MAELVESREAAAIVEMDSPFEPGRASSRNKGWGGGVGLVFSRA